MDAKDRIVDKTKVIIPEGTMEDFKRPNHFDFMASGELKRAGFSGLRHNVLTQGAEVWLLGEIKKTVSLEEMAADPLAINKAMEEVFALQGKARILPDSKEVRDAVEKGVI